MRTLTKARTAQLCNELRAARTRAIALSEREHGLDGYIRRLAGVEMALTNLVCDLAGVDAMTAVNASLDDPITPEEVAAYRATQAARQQAYLAQAAAAPAKPAHPTTTGVPA